MDKRLKYEKINNANNIITINLHNGYSIIAISGYDNEDDVFTTTLFLKNNTIDTWKLIDSCENLNFKVLEEKLNSAILKTVFKYLQEGFFDYYINRYEYELKCFDIGNELTEKERLGGVNAS